MDIVLLMYPGVTALDAVGPYEVLARLPGASIQVVGLDRGIVPTEAGPLSFYVDRTIDEVGSADLLLVPGGLATRTLQRDPRVLAWIAAIDRTTRITASVCTGALLLGAAGLLRGRRANTHWAQRERLREFGAEPVAERVVRDGKYATSAGVSAGIDLACELARELAGERTAQAIVLGLEYDPAPPVPFASVPTEVRAWVTAMIAEQEERFAAGT